MRRLVPRTHIPQAALGMPEELSASVWTIRYPHVVTFRETGRGRRGYFALKWEIRKERGESPWSEIQSEFVP
jgi:hypothetical protein